MLRTGLLQAQWASKRGFHCTAAALRPAVLPPFTDMKPATEEVQAAIVEARRQIFGVVPGNNLRSGRKVLRSNLKGAQVKAYYPTMISDLQLDRAGVEPAIREKFFRDEELNNRIGKTRIKGKQRGFKESFVQRMKVEDAEESVIEQVDYFHAEDALPDEAVVAQLEEGLDEEQKGVLHEVFERYAAVVEAGRLEKEESKASSSEDKKSRARERGNLRHGLEDTRLKDEVERGFAARGATAAASAEGGADAAGAEGAEAAAAAAEEEPVDEETKKLMADLKGKLVQLGLTESEIEEVMAAKKGSSSSSS